MQPSTKRHSASADHWNCRRWRLAGFALALALYGFVTGPSPARAQSGEETMVLPASRDTWTAENPGWRSNDATTVDHGSSPSLVVGYHGPERGNSIGYIDVDLSGVQRGRRLQSAHLELFALRSDGGPATAPIPPIEIRPVTSRWGESAPQDWERPVSTRSASGTPWVHPAREAWARFDVTTEVRERLAGRGGQGWR